MTTVALLGTAGMGLVWGWLVVQVIPSLRPSGWAIAGLAAASALMAFTVFRYLGGQAVVVSAAAALVASLAHGALIQDMRRVRQLQASFGIGQGEQGWNRERV